MTIPIAKWGLSPSRKLADRTAARVLLLVLTVPLVACNQAPSGSSTGEPAPATFWRGGKLVLGSPSLTAGIAGSGPLTADDVRQWLARADVHQPLDFVLPVGLADAAELVSIPADNPLTRAKIELGRQLFFDPRLSQFSTMSCATCHAPAQDYSVHGVMPDNKLNPPVCFNRIFSQRQFWDGREDSLEAQALAPIRNPLEMGMAPAECAERLAAIEGYRLQFEAIFGKVDAVGLGQALASFQRALVTGASPWDYHRLLAKYEGRPPESLSTDERELVDALRAGAQANPLSPAARRGEALFFSERARCSTCHSGPNLTDEAFHNIGAGMEREDRPPGRSKVTGREEDIGAFKTPTLRNIANTASYMHNGQVDTLDEVVDWFDRGGFAHRHLDRNIRPLNLTREEKRDLVAFLEALTGALPPVEVARLPE